MGNWVVSQLSALKLTRRQSQQKVGAKEGAGCVLFIDTSLCSTLYARLLPRQPRENARPVSYLISAS
jgi:hypothetical protein